MPPPNNIDATICLIFATCFINNIKQLNKPREVINSNNYKRLCENKLIFHLLPPESSKCCKLFTVFLAAAFVSHMFNHWLPHKSSNLSNKLRCVRHIFETEQIALFGFTCMLAFSICQHKNYHQQLTHSVAHICFYCVQAIELNIYIIIHVR